MAGRNIGFAALVLVLLVSAPKFINTESTAEASKEDVPKTDAAGTAKEPITANRVGSKTDPEVVEREEDKIVEDGYSIKDQKLQRKAAEKFEFQAEVNRLMDIIINSLYSKKEVFLRELISNASDALDKIRFASLTDSGVLGDGDTAKLEIRIEADKEAKTLAITDRGIGMTKQDLINNLGTIAKSGTSKFLEAAGNSTDLNLIGQFGVGFYSVYLIADYVTVTTKHTDDKQYIWESKADSSFIISEDPAGPTLGRGTKITMHLKEDAYEYLEQDKLKELVKRYSEFINFPIYLYTSKEVDVEVPVEDESPSPVTEKEGEESEKKDEAKADETKTDADKDAKKDDKAEEKDADKEAKDDEKKEEKEKKEGEEDEEEEDDEDGEVSDVEEEKKPKTKTIKETKWEWVQLNDVKAIWTRDPKEVTKDEYANFFKSITKAYEDPLAHIHFKGEGEVDFKALLFIPGTAPADLFDNYADKSTALKLFVKRVFITDEFEDLMPKYLKFIQGVVDSDDLPLNVSREMLQQHKILKIIKKKLVKKVLDTIKNLSEKAEKARRKAEEDKVPGLDDEKKEDPEVEKDEDDKTEEDKQKEATKAAQEKYKKFYTAFGKNVKLGVIEDGANRPKLVKALRFYTSKSGDEMISLQAYVDHMKKDQKFIYYIAGESKEAVESAPFLERLVKHGYEVLYMIDPLDEYCLQHIPEFEAEDKKKYKLMSATKEGLKLGEDGEKEKKIEKKLKEDFKGLSDYLKTALGSKIEKVHISKRLAKSPAVLVTGQYGWSANMERIMKAQALGDPNKYSYMVSKKTLEINPFHPIVKKLNEVVKDKKDSKEAEDLAFLLFDTAAMNSGFSIEKPKEFSERVYRLMKIGLNLDPTVEVSDEDLKEYEKSEPAEEESTDDKKDDEEASEEGEKEDLPSHDEL